MDSESNPDAEIPAIRGIPRHLISPLAGILPAALEEDAFGGGDVIRICDFHVAAFVVDDLHRLPRPDEESCIIRQLRVPLRLPVQFENAAVRKKLRGFEACDFFAVDLPGDVGIFENAEGIDRWMSESGGDTVAGGVGKGFYHVCGGGGAAAGRG